MSKEHFELAKRIARYLQGELSPEEEADLLAQAAEDPMISALLKQYEDGERLANDLAFMDSVDKEADWEQILKKQTEVAAISHKTRPIWGGKIGWWAAACLFLVGGLFGWWKFYTAIPKGIVPDKLYGYKNDVLPGGNRATLTLSNGKEINLGNQDSLSLIDGSARLAAHKQIVNYVAGDISDTARYHTISTPRGGTYGIELPDGTKAWLNAESTLAFPIAFGKTRSVKLLAGEVYFEVAQRADAPFMVQGEGFQVEVLGTAFNVNTYVKKRAKTILTEGKVKVKRGEEYQIIDPGYAVTALPEKLAVQKVDTEEALSWKDGYFYFEGKNLQQILTEVARWYDVHVEYETTLSKTKYQGGMKRTATLASVCKILTDLSGQQFKIEGKKLIVTKL